jgi:hypothetical protein
MMKHNLPDGRGVAPGFSPACRPQGGLYMLRDLWRATLAWLFTGMVLLMTAIAGSAQSPRSVVEAHAVLASDAVHPDSTVKLAVIAQVTPGFHINDHKPSLDYLIATQVRLEANDRFSVEKVVYPKGVLQKFPFSDTPLSVYEGKVVVGVLLLAGKAVSPGTYTLTGKFAYQACNDHACLAPTSVPLTASIKIVPRSAPVKPTNADVFQQLNFQ